jgi:hypothetical protein
MRRVASVPGTAQQQTSAGAMRAFSMQPQQPGGAGGSAHGGSMHAEASYLAGAAEEKRIKNRCGSRPAPRFGCSVPRPCCLGAASLIWGVKQRE